MARERKVPDFSPDELSQIEGIKRRVLNEPSTPSAAKPAPVTKPIAPAGETPYYGFLNFAEGGKVPPNNRFGFATRGKYTKGK